MEAKIGVLIIHQNTSVFSIISQHLAERETKRRHMMFQSKESDPGVIRDCGPVVLLPCIIVVGFSDAPRRDENCRTSCKEQWNERIIIQAEDPLQLRPKQQKEDSPQPIRM